MASSRAGTFIGFSMRAGKYKIGLNAVATLKRANLIIVCSTASENTKKEGEKFAKRFRCPCITTIPPLEEFTHKENGKIMAITDKALALAILNNLGEELKIN